MKRIDNILVSDLGPEKDLRIERVQVLRTDGSSCSLVNLAISSGSIALFLLGFTVRLNLYNLLSLVVNIS